MGHAARAPAGGLDDRGELVDRQVLRSRDLDDLQGAADVVWVLNDPGLYHLLVNVRGWPAERYREWVAASLQYELLGDQ